jgi:protein-S-isoprenylcysteine O-methyltransferase Ste14
MPFLSRAVAGQVVVLCFAVFVVYWIVAAFGTKRTAERAGWWTNWLARGALIAVVLLLSRGTGSGSTNRILWVYSPTIGIIAVVVTVLGLLVVMWARAILAGNWSADAVIKEGHELIERGPYRYVRHPIYSGLILMAVGAVLVWGTPVSLAVLAGLPVMLWVKLSQEERLLTRHFPDEYPRYKARVKALIPFVI